MRGRSGISLNGMNLSVKGQVTPESCKRCDRGVEWEHPVVVGTP